MLLKNGCICCTVRGDILDTLEELFRRRETGELPWFRRIAIETTGLADPAPVAHTLSDTTKPCHLDGIVVTADAIHLQGQLHDQEEARNQIALADRVLLTKTDLVTPAEAAAAEQAIRRFNPHTPICRVVDGNVDSDLVFGLGFEERPQTWLRPAGADPHHHHQHDHSGISAVVLRAETPIFGPALALWIDSLLSLHGVDVFRLKGIVRIAGVEDPLVVQAVHHVLHSLVKLPPRAAAAWAGAASEIVVIQRGLPETGLRTSFAAALRSGVTA